MTKGSGRKEAEGVERAMRGKSSFRISFSTFSCTENRDVSQLVRRRNLLVQVRTRVMNQLQAIAITEGVRNESGLRNPAGRALGVGTASLAGLILVQNSFAAISTKRILTIVMPGKIIA